MSSSSGTFLKFFVRVKQALLIVSPSVFVDASFYTQLEGADRTFCILPTMASLPDSYIRAQKRFAASKNLKAKNEIEA